MSKIKFYICILMLAIMVSCVQQEKKTQQKKETEIALQKARCFKVYNADNYTRLEITTPWQDAGETKFNYYLVKKGEKPTGILEENIIETPVRKVVCLSTTHIALLDFIGETGSIKGVSNPDFIYNNEINKAIKKGEIKDVGSDNNLNYETLIKINPDVIFVYGVNSAANQLINKLKSLKLKVVLISEYMEEDMLGKAEWAIFVSYFFNKDKQAQYKFQEIKSQYDSLKTLAKNCSEKPKIMTGMPYKGNWWISGGKTHLAMAINDAGGNFLWSDNPSRQTESISFETVFQKAANADIWLQPGVAKSKNEMEKMEPRIKNLSIFKNGKIYNNNARQTEFGGNDYWESGTVNPHLILKDMITIFHPGLIKKHELIYYKEL